MNMASGEARGRRMRLVMAMNQVQSAATVGASRERRCQRVRGVFFGGAGAVGTFLF
jgi:hypothetical protein